MISVNWFVALTILLVATCARSETCLAGSATQGHWSKIGAIRIELESERLPLADKLNADESHPIIHRIISVSSTAGIHYFCGHNSAPNEERWRDEPFNVEMSLSDRRMLIYHKFNRIIEVPGSAVRGELPAAVNADILCCFVPVWPFSKLPPPGDDESGMIFPVHSAINSPKYQELQSRELIGTEHCISFRATNQRDQLWLAAEKDFCLMRRVWFDKKGNVIAELNTKDVARVANGLWLPSQVEFNEFAVKRPDGIAPIVKRTRTRVLRCEVNDEVPDSSFNIVPESGTIEFSGSGEFSQKSPGGTDHLSRITEYLRGSGGLPQKKDIGNKGLVRIPVAILAAAVGYVIGMTIRRSYTSILR